MRATVTTVSLAAMAVALSATVTVAVLGQHPDSPAPSPHEDYLQAARQVVLDLTTVSAATVDEDVERISSAATGSFAAEFGSRVEDFAAVVREAAVDATGSVTEAGVETANDDTATVLVAATSTVTNASGAVAEPRTWRMRLGLVREDDRIAVASVVFVP
ncbi:hypothetical protein [Rhodococcoides kroppenstedtii]|uniref:hypothetical protein n=1 Tax=Rhodococcoides kroppenstedtii TaxID=293050 RepID=UPI0028E678A2|nr:hypothetical protein [Rhodococcus kroppenstedtii]